MRYILIAFILCTFSVSYAQRVSYDAMEFRLPTEWTRDVDPDNPLKAYPRPQMTRPDWQNLNGRWHFTISEKDESLPERFEREIIVPFAVESDLSGVKEQIGPDKKLWYKRTFYIPDDWSEKFILLHFGASDWETTVYINDVEIGKHRGGYDAFSFDISPYLDERGVQEIIVSVWDPTNAHFQPRGKQQIAPNGIWYTPVSGIWQTVWIEPVNVSAIESIKTTPDIDKKTISISTNTFNLVPGDSIRATISFHGILGLSKTFSANETTNIPISNPQLWSSETPNLYDLQLELVRDGNVLDKVQSYFGMRKIEIAEDSHGKKRLFLNNKPIFQYGLLDQGWWPDGLYTAPSDEALKFDIAMSKEMGFNLIRKHVKIEPARWYYHCDQLGMLVWQDMPNSDKNAEWKGPSGIDGVQIEREFASEAQYKIEYQAMVDGLYNHPSIVKWVPFNEGWGQFKTVEIYDWVATLDTTRLIGGPSGGNYFPVGDTRDHHKYPGPEMPLEDKDRALILGEFGGLGLPVEDHLWQSDKNWGYRNLQKRKDLVNGYLDLVNKFPELIDQGLAGAIYTQTTDVEGEVNGMMTYDRKVLKLKGKKVQKAHAGLYQHFDEVVK